MLLAEFGGPAQVARESGTPKSHFSAMSAAKRGLGDDLAEKLETLYNKPAGWFDQPVGDVNVVAGPALRGQVPLISWVRAGSFCEAMDPFAPGDAERWMDCPVNHSSSTFALRVRGDSMTAPHGNGRTYPEGCIIFVDPERRSPVNGERIVACLESTHEVTFKVYKNEDGRQWLQPLNPSHEPIRESFKVLGTVLGKWEDG